MPERIIKYLNEHPEEKLVSTIKLAAIFQEDHQKVIGALKSIEARGDQVVSDVVSEKIIELTEEGKVVAENGSHEAAIFNAVPEEAGISQSELMKLPNAKVGFSKAMSNGWVLIDKSANPPLVKRKVPTISDLVQQQLKLVAIGQANSLSEKDQAEYKKRKLIQESVVKSFMVGRGTLFDFNYEKLETDLTADMLADGSWKSKEFKSYNFSSLGRPPTSGFLHPLLKVRSEFRQIFLEMGFSEMPTNNYVEKAFWNFDALFQPQHHPARDAHDTFFISHPLVNTKFPLKYVENVKQVHSHGEYGSQGYGYDWDIEEAQKGLLRTHTTAVSARMLYKAAQQEQFTPMKLFSIDKVFRNETLDATHLAEFHQVEGLIADTNLTLGNLIGVITEFFKKLGLTELKFKPAYNPYTEPSMEIFCYHPGLGKWIELGNSGIFRPEMLRPMGFNKKVKVIAWGLSLERPTMIKYGYNNIRDLVGPKVDLEMIQKSPLCRLDKNPQDKQAK